MNCKTKKNNGGRKPVLKDRTPCTFNIEKSTLRKYTAAAKKAGVSRSSLMRQVLEQGLKAA